MDLIWSDVNKSVAVIEQSCYTYETGGMATTVEVPDLDTLFDLVKKVHAATWRALRR
ncbi:MAG: thiamine-binding protein [Deltaproteobacteria bacterium]|nr:thiamine-binding protein [Deltaproteobacteria bacterium]MBW1863166.1 thiamine-binding protein [Deltaproteobacteria bacterium]